MHKLNVPVKTGTAKKKCLKLICDFLPFLWGHYRFGGDILTFLWGHVPMHKLNVPVKTLGVPILAPMLKLSILKGDEEKVSQADS